MRGLTDSTQAAWSVILTMQYVLVDACYQQLDVNILPERKFAPQGMPDFSDSEVMTIALFGEMVFAGDEERVGHGSSAATKNVVTVTFIVAPDTKNVVGLKPTSRFRLTKRSHTVTIVAFFVAALLPLLRFVS